MSCRTFVALALIAASTFSPRPAAAQLRPSKTAGKPASGRWALLVGVDDYAHAEKLHFCGADVRALGEQLVTAGFPKDHVYLLHDEARETKYRPVKTNIEEQLALVLGLAEKDDLVVVCFSGHGVHLDGKSYLCPADTRLDDPKTMVALDAVYDRLEKCPAALKLMLVDACRNDPRIGGQKSLTPTEGTKQFATTLEKPPRGILLLTSCAAGEISMEEKKFGHGNVAEWCADWLHPGYYSQSPKDDPQGPTAATDLRVLRGGSWFNSPVEAQSAYRFGDTPGDRTNYIGFRAARSLD